MKVALDQSCPNSILASEELEDAGIEIVYRVGDHEYDEDWVENAYFSGADVFVSPDLDIPNLLDRLDIPGVWVDVPQKLRRGTAGYIIKQLLRIKKLAG